MDPKVATTTAEISCFGIIGVPILADFDLNALAHENVPKEPNLTYNKVVTRGTGISIGVAVLAVSGMVYAFLNNSVEYVTVAQAKERVGTEVHIVGDIQKETIRQQLQKGSVDFLVKDEAGDAIPVHYQGPPISNLGAATKVVIIGKMGDQYFEAKKVLVKCPSKYEGEQGGKPKSGY